MKSIYCMSVEHVAEFKDRIVMADRYPVFYCFRLFLLWKKIFICAIINKTEQYPAAFPKWCKGIFDMGVNNRCF